MDDAVSSTPLASPQAPVDLSVLERIEGELEAVERALEQIDRGVYDGFAGLDGPPDASDSATMSAPVGEDPPGPAVEPAP